MDSRQHARWVALGLSAAVLTLTACGSTATSTESPNDPATPSATPTATSSLEPTPVPTASTDGAESVAPSDRESAARDLAADVAQLLTAAPDPAGTLGAQSAPAAPGGSAQEAPIEGGDVSWPQCPKAMGIPERPTQGSPMPLTSARFVVIGLTNGPGFTPNPCLAEQVAWARERKLAVSAYSVVSWPSKARRDKHAKDGPFDSTTEQGRLANAGYAQGRFNLANLRAAEMMTPAIWLDVEPVPDFDWPAGNAAVLARNAQIVRGVARAYHDAGFTVGIYSTTALWKRAVGDLTLGMREWRAAGHTSRAEALRRCGQERSIQGGTAVISQWVEHGRDRNVTCPGEAASLPLWFHQY